MKCAVSFQRKRTKDGKFDEDIEKNKEPQIYPFNLNLKEISNSQASYIARAAMGFDWFHRRSNFIGF